MQREILVIVEIYELDVRRTSIPSNTPSIEFNLSCCQLEQKLSCRTKGSNCVPSMVDRTDPVEKVGTYVVDAYGC
jgi:hypothetical protein